MTALTGELVQCRDELAQRTTQVADLERKLVENEKLRRKMHNTIQELRGNVRVHVRLRPFLPSDRDEHAPDAVPAMLAETQETVFTVCIRVFSGWELDGWVAVGY